MESTVPKVPTDHGPMRRKSRLAWAAWFAIFNGALAALIASRYLPWMQIPDAGVGAYVGLLYTGQFLLLALLPGLLLVLLAALLRRPALTVLGVLAATAGQAVLVLDTVVYSQFRFHLSGFVLELLLNAGSEVFSFSWATWLSAGLLLLALLALQAGLAWLLWRRRPAPGWLVAVALLTVGAQLGAHGWHAWADANYDSRITSISRHVPLYYGATGKRFFQNHGLVDPEAVRRNSEVAALGGAAERGALNYPAGQLACEAPSKRLNVLFVVVDSLRADMLDPRWMPNVSAFAGHASVFRRHFSNGNATKPGIFTLFYGLPASYWDAFSTAGQPPVLMQRLRELGYSQQILASATLVSPAFDRNVFAGIEELRLSTPGDHPWQRDERITRDWLAFTDAYAQGERDQPFFGFLFYDTPHTPRVPPGYPRFEPYWERVNELELRPGFDREPYFNVYKTAVHYTDSLIGRVLHDLASKRLLDDTIVVITSDHGQEFNDNGLNYWGHGSNFSDVQLKVPLVVHWPGQPAGEVDHHTEHFDVAPELMRSALGCADTDARAFASGSGLYDDPPQRWSIAHSYMNYALLMKELRVVTHPAGGVDMLTPDLAPAGKVPLNAALVAEVLREMSRFYQ